MDALSTAHEGCPSCFRLASFDTFLGKREEQGSGILRVSGMTCAWRTAYSGLGTRCEPLHGCNVHHKLDFLLIDLGTILLLLASGLLTI